MYVLYIHFFLNFDNFDKNLVNAIIKLNDYLNEMCDN